jgi:hypothetical protein
LALPLAAPYPEDQGDLSPPLVHPAGLARGLLVGLVGILYQEGVEALWLEGLLLPVRMRGQTTCADLSVQGF